MKFESSNEDHIFSIEMYDDNASARVNNFLKTSVHLDIVDSPNSDSVEANLIILKGNGELPEVFVTDDALHISTKGLWEKSSLAASLLAAAELLEPGIITSVDEQK
ncbi:MULTISPECIES: hypothetical protein [Vibrio harveyi group]|nr:MULTISPECIES: hypothetical protein [Vibrio harveyi group]ANQ55849.1 hypothetical protein AB831_06580 [Vibrio parahaemolyticus]ASO15725.1 hypothetical protein BGM07_015785 [Vibrio parahaemolyticus]AWA89758.1 hypothetical protein BSG32_12210 [Vibrio parahaemolyticus]EGQ7715997.1 hypothetical protein [Vibrio parahaemolyticus]EGQ7722200.1 hypothetical protein [Vibrio parahaemolyticus]